MRISCSVLLIALALAPSLGRAAPSVDRRADAILKQMTLDEKIALVHGDFPAVMHPMPPGVVISAGYIAGIPRLGVPALRESDASLGVANAGRTDDDATALPSGLALAATWDPAIARAGGAMIGKQTRQKGFNVLLGGGVNLTRDPFNGRNFEYLGEDPLLAGVMDGAAIAGVQSQPVVSTAKHFVLNAQETGRHVLDARIGEAALRESDLLAFQIALEQGRPGSVMCSYNLINGVPACDDPDTLTRALKTDWGFKGWVMSDWGAVHGLDAATAGLDQESAGTLDGTVYFGAPLKAAIQSGQIPAARLDDMVRRILYGMIANGLLDPAAPAGALDARADDPVAQTEAEAAIVLLKNRGDILPLAASARRIAVIGGHADVGVLSGGGSAQVVPAGSIRLPAPAGAPDWVRGIYYHPSAPLAAIRAHAKGATVDFASGQDISAAVAAARAADVAIVFAEQWASEAIDVCIRLSQAQEDLITAVAAANPHTVVVLESGGPVLAPWADRVGALVEAWYPGGRGGEAIARVLFGEVDPSGRLPVTFAASADQWPRSQPQGPVENLTLPEDKQTPFAVDYKEGSSVGYRWFAQNGYKPRFPFGYGLSYTRFRYGALSATGGQTVTVRLPITNTGARRGRETAQLYLLAGPQRSQKRLLGWAKVELEPGQTQIVRIQADPRLLANWDEHAHAWRLDGGRYTVVAAANAGDPGIKAVVAIKGSVLKP